MDIIYNILIIMEDKSFSFNPQFPNDGLPTFFVLGPVFEPLGRSGLHLGDLDFQGTASWTSIWCVIGAEFWM